MTELQRILASSITTLALTVGGAAPEPAPCPPRGITLNAEVIRVLDGDTICCRVTYDFHVRLIDCWAPETRLSVNTDQAEKERGLASKEHLIELVESRHVRVHMPTTGRLSDLMSFGRALGRVWRLNGNKPEDQDISTLMVRDGFALAKKPPREVEQ